VSTLEELRESVASRRAELDDLRPLRWRAIEALRLYFDLDLTYTSNAIEGNTLTARETAELIEHGITVGGKQLRDHLEAEDHFAAVQWMREMAAASGPIGEKVVTELHRRIVLRSRPEIAGLYSEFARRIRGSAVIFPAAHKLPGLMEAFGAELEEGQATPDAAFDAHLRLVSIHPFSDGNGRTARLLMNLILIRGGWPPISVRPEDRDEYLAALEAAQLNEERVLYDTLMYRRLDATLADYVGLMREALVDGKDAR
jgi:Fic family protein